MAKALSPLRLYRKNFGKIERVVEISNLIEMQKESYTISSGIRETSDGKTEEMEI